MGTSVFDPLNPEKFDATQYPALRRPPASASAAGNITTPAVVRTVPSVTTPAAAADGFAPITNAFSRPTLTQPSPQDIAAFKTRQAGRSDAYGNAMFGQKPTTFEGVNLEQPAPASAAYRLGQALPGVARAVGSAARGVGTVASAATDVMSYPVRKFVNDGQQLVAGVTGAAAPAPSPLIRPNAAAPAAAVPALAAAGTVMPRTKGSVMRDGRSATPALALPAVASASATPAAPTAASGTPSAAPVAATAIDGGGTFNGRPVAELLRNPISNVGASPNVPGAVTTAAPGIAGQAPAMQPAATVAPTLVRPTLQRKAFRDPDAVATDSNQAEDRAMLRDVASKLDSALFRNSFAVGRGSRSARAQEAQMLAALAGMAGGANRDATQVQIADTNNATARGNTQASTTIADANNAADVAIEGSRAQSAERIAAAQNASVENQSQLQAQSEITDADGNVFLRNGATAAPVMSPDGKQLRRPLEGQGQITAQDRLKALTDQMTAESSALQPNAERINALQGQIDALTSGGQQPARPSLDQFLAAARAANPNATDEQLTSFYNTKYGR